MDHTLNFGMFLIFIIFIDSEYDSNIGIDLLSEKVVGAF